MSDPTVSNAAAQTATTITEPNSNNGESNGSHEQDRKRKRFENNDTRHGGRNKKRDMGGKNKERNTIDKREVWREDRERKQEKSSMLPAAFEKEEIDAEDRQPKRKVAVLVGYAGTGYKGMQISPTEKTIEGELFTAFVKAGAISKANADDPRKSTLVRCARTDKGVHAAGNMISLKLIIEDPNVVANINAQLPPQIRIWGIERTTGSFSCYHACDSRWYEYLIPSSSFLPPHPSSFLARKIEEYAKEVGDDVKVAARQEDVKNFWEEMDEKHVKPVLEGFDAETRELVSKAIWAESSDAAEIDESQDDAFVRSLADIGSSSSNKQKKLSKQDIESGAREDDELAEEDTTSTPDNTSSNIDNSSSIIDPNTIAKKEALSSAIKLIRQTYETVRRAYRISPSRIENLQSCLSAYTGTRNFHNYTVSKNFNDPSAKRTIRSFIVNPTPIIINGTEWLSLKVHGQSFMMHQIRKMVGMATLLVRCGADGPKRIPESYGKDRWSIPKVPGLGLLLERPVFDSYNENVAKKFEKEKLDFGKFEKEIEDFKRAQIYGRIWEEEGKGNTFHQFFNHIDNYAQQHFLYLTSKGYEATRIRKKDDNNKNVEQEIISTEENKEADKVDS